MAKHECKKCGKCCHVGTLWAQSNHPLIDAFAEFVSGKGLFRDDGKCQMLINNECLIHKYLGEEFKPDVCRQFPFEEGDCKNGNALSN